MKSFARSPIEPSSIPKAVDASALATTTTASAGTASQPGRKCRSTTPTRNAKPEMNALFASTGTPRPRKIAARLAGEARIGPSVPNQRSFATAIDIPNTAENADTWIALPTTKNESGSRVAYRPR